LVGKALSAHVIHTTSYRVENSAQVSSCQLNFVHGSKEEEDNTSLPGQSPSPSSEIIKRAHYDALDIKLFSTFKE